MPARTGSGASRRSCTRSCGSATRAGTRCCAAASRSSVLARRRREAIGATLGPRALALDDAAQALTFATRAAGHALLGGDARRPAAQLAALARARRA